jgi:two-component system, cell cycle sensor histidine kinase and response regulator CckA
VTIDSTPDLPLAGTRTILVVDDVGVVRQAAFRLLSEAGYRVFEAGSATEALEVLATSRQPIDLVLVDVVMPDVSGVALARLIHEEWPAVRVLFMSAYPAEILVREGLDHPNVFFLAKPFTRSELMDRVVTALLAHPHQEAKASRTFRPSS